jgi:hypothetical protein
LKRALFPNSILKRIPVDDDTKERIFRLDIEAGRKKGKG